MRRPVVAIMATFALLGGSAIACGEDNGDLRAEVREDILRDEGDNVTEDEADCIAGEVIDRLGASDVRELMEEPDEADMDFEDFGDLEDMEAQMQEFEEMFVEVEAAYEACGVDMFGGMDMDF